MHSKLNYLVLSFIILVCVNCKKPVSVDYKIFGTLSDSQSNDPISGAYLVLSAQILDAGTFNNSYQTLESVSTDSNGYFEFNIEKQTFNSIKVTFEKQLFFSGEVIFSPESVDPKSGLEVLESLDPMAFVNLNLRNISPINEQDELAFRYISAYFPDCICCNNDFRYFDGMDVDTVISCAVVGNSQLDYNYIVTKGGGSSNLQGGEFIESFQTVEIEINY